MVLSYLPSQAMRIEMIQKATQCLLDEGVLLVIETPIILRGGALYSDAAEGDEGCKTAPSSAGIAGFTAMFESWGLQLMGGRWKRGERPCQPLLGAFRKYDVRS